MKVAQSILHDQISYFKNEAIYKTKEGVDEAKDKISNLFGIYGKNVAIVKFKVVSEKSFIVEFFGDNHEKILQRNFISGKDFDLNADGAIIVESKSFCGSRDSPGIGCE